jgi:hypothetical protein
MSFCGSTNSNCVLVLVGIVQYGLSGLIWRLKLDFKYQGRNSGDVEMVERAKLFRFNHYTDFL